MGVADVVSAVEQAVELVAEVLREHLDRQAWLTTVGGHSVLVCGCDEGATFDSRSAWHAHVAAEIVKHNYWRDVAWHYAIRQDDFDTKI